MSKKNFQGRHLLTVINDRDYFNRHRRHIAEAAASSGWRSTVAMPVPGKSEVDDYADWRQIDLRPGRITPWHDLKVLVQLFLILRRDQPDLVHAITLKAIALSGMALMLYWFTGGRRIPLVATFAGLGYAFLPHVNTPREWLRSKIARMACLVAMAWSPLHTTFETEDDRQTVIKAFGVNPAWAHVVAGTGLNLEIFKPAPKPKYPFTLLFAGRLLRSKGVMAFLRAAELPEARKFRWLIAGWRYESPDALSEEEMREVCSSGCIGFLGSVIDMPALLNNVHALVLPSTYPEGIPRILIEAAATGTPMISTDFAGAREIVRHGETGFVIPDTSPQAILDAAYKMISLEDMGAAMGSCARSFVEAGGFNHAAVQTKFLSIYELAVSEQRHRS